MRLQHTSFLHIITDKIQNINIMKIVQVLLVGLEKKKCWIHCAKTTQIVSFVMFPLNHGIKRNSWNDFFPQNQQTRKFCPIGQSWSSDLLYHCLKLIYLLQKSTLLVEEFYRRSRNPYNWTWAQKFFRYFEEIKNYPFLQLIVDLHLKTKKLFFL